MKLQKAIKQLKNGAYAIKNSMMNVGYIQLHSSDDKFWFSTSEMDYFMEIVSSMDDFLDELWEIIY